MGMSVCRIQCQCPRSGDSSANRGLSSSSSKSLPHVVPVLQESRALGTHQEDSDEDSICTQEYGVDEVDIKRGVELATSAFLLNGDDTLVVPPFRSSSEQLPVDKILQIQHDLCQKILEQDRQIRRIVEGPGGEDAPSPHRDKEVKQVYM